MAKVFYNDYIPFDGYKAMSMVWCIFARNGYPLDDVDINHESIHMKQQKEMLIIPFFIWYLIEWVIRLFQYKGDTNKAYRNISFEREAFTNEKDMEYLKTRKHYSFLKYIK